MTLGALMRACIEGFAEKLDDFRLAFMHRQVAGPDSAKMLPEYFERVRPLNDLTFAGAAKRLAADIEKLSGMPIQSRIDVVDGIATYWAGITMPGRGDVIVEGKTANDAIARLHYELHKPVAPEPPAPIAELPTDAESIEVTYDDVSDRDP